MMRLLPRWLSRRPPPPHPEAPLRIVGDVHGRADLLARVLARPGPPLVCVGDYVDRGADSAGVLRMLAERPEVVCLMGNHEEMMLTFLDDPGPETGRWLRHGGVQTLLSFGIGRPEAAAAAGRFVELAQALRAAMGPELLAWLRERPSAWWSGNVAVVHAAADPARPIEEQHLSVLRWGHPDFPRRARDDGLWVVHGHVIVPAPRIRGAVISIDTGAWRTGRLTVARLAAGGIDFEEA